MGILTFGSPKKNPTDVGNGVEALIPNSDLIWGTYGEDGRQPLRCKKLRDCDTAHLQSMTTQAHIYHQYDETAKKYKDAITAILKARGATIPEFVGWNQAEIDRVLRLRTISNDAKQLCDWIDEEILREWWNQLCLRHREDDLEQCNYDMDFASMNWESLPKPLQIALRRKQLESK